MRRIWLLAFALAACSKGGGGSGDAPGSPTGFLSCNTDDPRCGDSLTCLGPTGATLCVDPPADCARDHSCDCLGQWLCGGRRCLESNGNLRCVTVRDDAGVGPPGDRDDDGVPDSSDVCPDTADNDQADRDDDGVGDACDDCAGVADHEQSDRDGDGRGDPCDVCPDTPDNGADRDSDGIGDACDICPDEPGEACRMCDVSDRDHDGIGDACDDCPDDANADQADRDFDGAGDACDDCPAVPDAQQADGDRDLVGDACDDCPGRADPEQRDRDGDRVGDACDDCPDVPNPDQADADGDGRGDVCPFVPMALGTRCQADAECASGFCTDGVCCDDRCDGMCEACSARGACSHDQPQEVFVDADGDGFGADATRQTVCQALVGEVARGGDCDDGDPGAHPGADEVCGDGIDQDCTGKDAIAVFDVGQPLTPLGIGVEADRELRGISLRSWTDGSYGLAWEVVPPPVRSGDSLFYQGHEIRYLHLDGQGAPLGLAATLAGCSRPALSEGAGGFGLACAVTQERVGATTSYIDWPYFAAFGYDGSMRDGGQASADGYAMDHPARPGLTRLPNGWAMVLPRSVGLDLYRFGNDARSTGFQRRPDLRPYQAGIAAVGASVGLVIADQPADDGAAELDFGTVDANLAISVRDSGRDLLDGGVGNDTVLAQAIAGDGHSFAVAGVARWVGLRFLLFGTDGSRLAEQDLPDVGWPALIAMAGGPQGFGLVVAHGPDDGDTWIDLYRFGHDGAFLGQDRVATLPDEHLQSEARALAISARGDSWWIAVVPASRNDVDLMRADYDRCAELP